MGMARVDEPAAKRTLTDLLSTVDQDYFADLSYRHYFSEQLPGINAKYSKDADAELLEVFQRVDREARDEAIASRRLRSPDHYRYYFALSGPSYALKQSDFDAFWNAVDSGASETAELLIDWHRETFVVDLSKTELLLERLTALADISAERSRNLFHAMGASLDDVFRIRPFGHFSVNTVWDRARKLLPRLLSGIAEEERFQVLLDLLKDGVAIGWLTSVLRSETFAQGRYGDQSQPEDKWIVTADQLTQLMKTMVGRYSRMTLEQILASPEPLNLLFAWRQAGDENGPRELLTASIAEDQNLIRLLEGLSPSTQQ